MNAGELFNKPLVRSIVLWLDEPCDEHCGYQVKDGIKTIYSIPHRKDCPKCWERIKSVYRMIRWYKGIRKCQIISSVSSLKTVKVQWDDGTCDIVPVRMCWRKPKEKKYDI